MTIDKIITAALHLDACDKVNDIGGFADAVTLLLSPQGREFAMRTRYPGLQTFRENIHELSGIKGVFVDSGQALASNMDCIAVGNTDLTLSLHGTGRLYHVMAMYGADVTVDAMDHAVVTVTDIMGNVRITGDGTAVINIER